MQRKNYQDFTSVTPICSDLLSESDERFIHSECGQEQLPYLQRFDLRRRDSGYRLYQLYPDNDTQQH